MVSVEDVAESVSRLAFMIPVNGHTRRLQRMADQSMIRMSTYMK